MKDVCLKKAAVLLWVGACIVGVAQAAQISANSSEERFGATNAYDQNPKTFWVSSGSPTKENPQWLTLTLDTPKKIDNLQILGRLGYGPHKGEIQVSLDGANWESVTTFTMDEGATFLANVDKTASQVRAIFHSAYDRAKLPAKARNVQVAELKLNVPPPVPYGAQKLSADLSGLSISRLGNAYSGNSVNANILRQSSIVSDATHQYTAYYDASGTVVLAKRALDSDQWELRRTQYTGNIRDAHNVISLGLDGDGYLHMSWDHHNHQLRYVRSVAPGSLDLGEKMKITGKFENKVTYPEFYNLPNGDLIFLYRNGGSGRGNLLLNRYDVTTKKWRQIHSNFISGEGNKRSPYWQMCMDKMGTIHISWVWRESSDVATNHDMAYAKSTDGGVTWQKSTGEPYTLPIIASTAEYAARIPQKHELINTTGICADHLGNPYIVTYFRPIGTTVPQYHMIYKTGAEWKTVQVSQRTTPFSLSGGGTKKIPISRPRILAQVLDGKNSAYMFFRDIERDNRISVAICDDLKKPSWEMKDLTDTSVNMWEPSLDSAAWQRDKTVYLFAQRVEQGDGEKTVASKPSVAAIIKWKPEIALRKDVSTVER